MERRSERIPIEEQAGQIVVEALKEAGVNLRYGNHPAVQDIWWAWMDGELTRFQAIERLKAIAPKL